MLAPFVAPSFLRGLARDFHGDIRVRWSPVRNRWQIERKGKEVAKLSDPKDRFDTWVRVATGYYRVMECSPGSLICCSYCQKDYSQELFTLKAAKCPACGKEELVMNWPLGDRLLEHLRFTDPERDGLARMWADLERDEKALEVSQQREKDNIGEAIWKEEFTNLFEIQSRGYEGPAKAWLNAPKSKMFGGGNSE
jgi:RNA polymerase subunit RPABC4/transcription elongation factor Spt4